MYIYMYSKYIYVCIRIIILLYDYTWAIFNIAMWNLAHQIHELRTLELRSVWVFRLEAWKVKKKGNSHSSQISWHMNHMKLKSENKTKLMDLVTTIIWFHEGYSWPVPPPEIEKWAVKDCQAVAVPSTQLSWHCWKTRISGVSGHSCGKSTTLSIYIYICI